MNLYELIEILKGGLKAQIIKEIRRVFPLLASSFSQTTPPAMIFTVEGKEIVIKKVLYSAYETKPRIEDLLLESFTHWMDIFELEKDSKFIPLVVFSDDRIFEPNFFLFAFCPMNNYVREKFKRFYPFDLYGKFYINGKVSTISSIAGLERFYKRPVLDYYFIRSIERKPFWGG